MTTVGQFRRRTSRLMSRRNRNHALAGRQAAVFAAFGDKTRLLIVAKLSSGEPSSISQLTTGSRLTRQAITKHLRVLQSAGVVHNLRSGRENRFQLDPKPIEEMKSYLEFVSSQ